MILINEWYLYAHLFTVNVFFISNIDFSFLSPVTKKISNFCFELIKDISLLFENNF